MAKKKVKRKSVKKKPPKCNLTIKQDNFCVHYVETGNATEAYKRTYSYKKQKSTTINRNAKKLMDNSKIIARIAELRKPIFDKLEVSAGKTLKRLMQGQEFDMRKLYNKNGTIKKPHELDDDTAKAIVGARYDRDGNLLEYKIIDVKGCSELVGKHLKLFTDVIEIIVPLTEEQEDDSLGKIAEILSRRHKKKK